MAELSKQELIARELNLMDSAAMTLTGASITTALRRNFQQGDLIIAGTSETGRPFIITISAEGDDAAHVVAVVTGGTKEIGKMVTELKEDIDRAGRGERVKL